GREGGCGWGLGSGLERPASIPTGRGPENRVRGLSYARAAGSAEWNTRRADRRGREGKAMYWPGTTAARSAAGFEAALALRVTTHEAEPGASPPGPSRPVGQAVGGIQVTVAQNA